MQSVEQQQPKPEENEDIKVSEDSEGEEKKKDTAKELRGNTDLLPPVER